ncbi:MAG: hypothetical protein LBS19_07805 [Clostridiales bacterium]|jgi:hypothetical protein|nr:hypothetical protein [Clostridiales bacterium]
MDMFTVLAGALLIVAGMGVFLYFRQEKANEALRLMRQQQKQQQETINHVYGKVAEVSSQNMAQEQANHLIHEQIYMKLDAVDACKAMIRETWR